MRAIYLNFIVFFLQGNQVFFGMDFGCGQGNQYANQYTTQSHNGIQNEIDKKHN